jgi:hypothetical protein
VSDAEALTWALQAARTAADQGASADQHILDRMARAGTTALETLLSCESHVAWNRPAAGTPDPLRVARHDVRSAAQAVLGQLELIGIAWPSWDAATQSQMLGELEESSRQLADQARRFTREAT